MRAAYANAAPTGPYIPSAADLRGFQLHLWKKRGVFKNMVSRQEGLELPGAPNTFSELKLNAEEIAEIDFRFEAGKPYLKPNPPRFNTRRT